MKFRCVGEISKDPEQGYSLAISIDQGPKARAVRMHLDPEEYDPESSEPRRWNGIASDTTDGIWLFRGTFVWVEESSATPAAEVILRIKHAVLTRAKELRRIAREVEAFENMDRVKDARRERIPDSVRLFVWQRDEGKCVRCGTSENLEFDHIIPVAKGGASTQRNVQLLCEACNRAKSASI